MAAEGSVHGGDTGGSVSIPAFVRFDLAGVARLLVESPVAQRLGMCSVGLKASRDVALSGNLAKREAALIEQWCDGGQLRRLLWSECLGDPLTVIEWFVLAIRRCRAAGADGFGRLVALDLVDLHAAVHRPGGASGPTDLGQFDLAAWMSANDVEVASTVDAVLRAQFAPVTALWVDGLASSHGEHFDGLVHAAITRRGVAVEFDEHLRRHLLMPLSSVDDGSLDSEIYCVDLVTGDGGWLNRFDTWTWEPKLVA